MNKLLVISGLSFAASEIFAVASLAHSHWLSTDADAGDITIGLISQCRRVYGRERTCYSYSLPPEWYGVLVAICIAILSLALTCGFILVSKWHPRQLIYAQCCSFIAITSLCLVGALFPVGFRQLLIGGEAFKLPTSWKLGDSYKLFWTFSFIFSLTGWCMLLMPMRIWMINR